MIREIRCKTLLGHKGLEFSIACLQSFVNRSYDNIKLQIFEDGTLTAEDEIKLIAAFDDVIVVKRSERDEYINRKLANHPRCLEYRNSTVYAHKIFDVMLFDEEDLFFIDSDIWFLKNFTLPDFNNTPAFIEDKQSAYSLKPLEFLQLKTPLFPFVNTGFIYFPSALFNLDLVEKLLQDPIILKGKRRGIPWLEQTMWSFLAAQKKEVNYFDRDQVMMAKKELGLTDQTIAIHLVSSYRYHYDELRKLNQADTEMHYPVRLKTVSTYLKKIDFAVEKIVIKLKRHLT
jgi:hypothetical protein